MVLRFFFFFSGLYYFCTYLDLSSSAIFTTNLSIFLQVVDVVSSETIHVFTPCKELHDEELPPSEPPITKMFTSSDGQWLAAINCFGDVYIFNLEIWRYKAIIRRTFVDKDIILGWGTYICTRHTLCFWSRVNFKVTSM